MKQVLKKYKIDECLGQLTIKEYKIAIKLIPEILDIAVSTFQSYRNMQLGDKQDIPYEKVKSLEILFNIQPGTLQNFVVTGSSLKSILYKDIHPCLI